MKNDRWRTPYFSMFIAAFVATVFAVFFLTNDEVVSGITALVGAAVLLIIGAWGIMRGKSR